VDHLDGFDRAEQLERFHEWIGGRAMFLQTFPSAASCIVRAGDREEFINAISTLEAKKGNGI